MNSDKVNERLTEIDLERQEMSLERETADHKSQLEKIEKLYPEVERFDLEKNQTKLNLEIIETARRNVEILLKVKDLTKIDISNQIESNLKVMELINNYQCRKHKTKE